ncbi:DUF5694 domain-containing protein [Sphingomonas sp. RB3P16]|uniref:DUF5694 domain-containing protein n=1 Tax=Parasphingomonas frigoris TaxID=3096163 RepID=UPI002FC7CDBB
MIAAVAGASTATAQAYRPFDTGRLKGPHSGPQNQLLVLGSMHLSGMPAAFRPEQLDPVLDKLTAWRPQAIAIEAVSGSQCDFMRHYPDHYKDSVESYCWDPAPAAKATGLDVPSATAAWSRLLAAWPATPSAADRRRLAALFLAGGEGASALVQWLRLPENERHVGEGLDATLVARLERLRTRNDESLSIAAALAARLGLERVYAMDDHTADAPVTDEKGYEAVITKAWDNPASAKRKAMDAALTARLGQPGTMLAMYRAFNRADQAKQIFASDFGAALEESSKERFGRGYVGYWETRNLRMASNIRDMFGVQPGIRGLVVVGASHKPYLENYLNQMHDMTVVDAEAVLR